MKRICKLMIFMIFRMINGLFIVLIWIVENEKNIALTQTEKVSASKVAVDKTSKFENRTRSASFNLSSTTSGVHLAETEFEIELENELEINIFINKSFIGKSQILF